MFPQQAALQTPSLQAAAKCPCPRSAARSRGALHRSGGAINTPGWAGEASWVMERQRQGGVSGRGLLGCTCWFSPHLPSIS